MPFSRVNEVTGSSTKVWQNEISAPGPLANNSSWLLSFTSKVWDHTQQLAKGIVLVAGGVLGYSWIKSSGFWTGYTDESNLLVSADKNSLLTGNAFSANAHALPLDPIDKPVNLNINYQSTVSVANEEKTLTQRDLAKRTTLDNEFQINNYTISDQGQNTVISLANNNFVVGWSSNDQDGSGEGIYGQLFDSMANKIGPEFRINSYTLNAQTLLAMSAINNKFIVIWQSYGQGSSGWGVYGQLFDEFANKIGSEIQISDVLADQFSPGVASFKNNNFLVYWLDNASQFNNAYAQIINFNNTSLNTIIPAFPIESSNIESQGLRADVLNNDNFVIAWPNKALNGTGVEINARLYNSTANSLSSKIKVTTDSNKHQSYLRVTGLENGNFLITWRSEQLDSTHDIDLYSRLYNSLGNPISSEFLINTYTTGLQLGYTIVPLNNGKFFAGWSSPHDGSDNGIFGQLFDENGNKIGLETQINTYTLGNQTNAKGCVLNDQRIVVTWLSYARDGSGLGVYGKILDTRLYATSSNQTIIYTENIAYKLIAITINPPIFIDTISASLQLSDKMAGRLITGTSNNVTALFNSTQGLWQAAGTVNDVNNLLANIVFQPTQYFNGNFTIKVNIDDGFNVPLNDTITVQGIAVNQAPVIENNQLMIEQGQKVILSSSHLSATDVDTDNATLVFAVNNVRHGQFEFIDDPDTVINSFTQQQIQAGKVIFKQDGNSETPAYKVSVSDGQLTTDFSSARIKFIPTATMTPSNQAAIIAGSVVGSIVGAAAITAAIGLFADAYRNKKWCFKPKDIPISPEDVEIAEISPKSRPQN